MLTKDDRIEDPNLGFNELKAEWVGDKSWTYKKTLPKAPKEDGQVTYLAFDGLDTFATVKLNGKVILESDNMWIPHRVDATSVLDASGDNVLEIDFEAALLRAREIRKKYPDHKWVCFNGEPDRMGVRKAQYHWGWDWGPVLMTAGPWRAVRMETYHARIADLWVEYKLDSSFKSASGTIFARIEGPKDLSVALNVGLAGRQVVDLSAVPGEDGVAKVEFQVKDAQLWYPHGYGSQPLYDFTASISSGETKLDTQTKKIGLRQVDLVQEPDKVGKTFYFRINGVDVYCGGSDWIPADNFIPRITNEKYRRWIQMMVDGNQVMIRYVKHFRPIPGKLNCCRVWGGGIWEEDVFYDLCDELGVMVWQDFMFGCGNYPCWPELLESVRKEATVNVQRLRHHAAMVIYAGNNEDYQVQEQQGLTYNYEDKDPENWLKTDFPARYIYEKLLPEVVAAESPAVPYHPGSPWGDGKPTPDQTVGDMHQWNVWHGTQEKYQIFDTLGGRFNSEFGMEAFPHIETIKYFVTDDSQLYPQSHMIDFHNKADGHERRIATYLVENFRTHTGLEEYVHLTQLSQSEALMFGYRGWRKRWGQDRFCGGALVWQLNDCWPVTSWSICDYFQRKKPAYYAMARTLAPIAIGVQRAHHDWSVVHARPAKTSDWELWVASFRREEVTATVELKFVSIKTGKEIKDAIIKKDITITANGTTDVLKGIIDNTTEEPHVLAARTFINDQVVARDTDWPQPLKYLSFEDRELDVKVDGSKYIINAQKPVKGLVFEEREGVLINDSAIDIVPGDEQILTVKGIKDGEKALGYTYLGRTDK